MDEFFSEMQKVRDAVEERQVYDSSSTDDWNTLTSSMDALEDTHHAISAFVAVTQACYIKTASEDAKAAMQKLETALNDTYVTPRKPIPTAKVVM